MNKVNQTNGFFEIKLQLLGSFWILKAVLCQSLWKRHKSEIINGQFWTTAHQVILLLYLSVITPFKKMWTLKFGCKFYDNLG